jgi:endoglucanase
MTYASSRETRTRTTRSLARVAALACALLLSALAFSGQAAAAGLSIKVEGNHFVNGSGQTIRLLGVNHPSFEYACDQGYAYNDGHMDDADATAVASWNATAVRVPLNQSCWLGINGDPNSDQGPPQPLTVAGYRQAVQTYVAALHAHGLYAILDLHWTGPLAAKADGQRPMPDGHSIDFWKSVAETFRDDPAVVLDLFNEPYSPAAVNDPAHPVTWACWRDGGCQLPISNDGTDPPSKTLYPAVGMQALVDTVRATGAAQPVLLGGLDYANDLTQWLTFRPNDPLGQEAASFHNYQGKSCDNAGCWNSTIAGVAAQVPVVTGEFAQDICAPSNFDEEYMTWADGNGVGYLAWGWWVLSPQEIADAGCSAYYLLSDYNGTPAAPNGTALHDHLAKLPANGGGTTMPPPATPGPGAPKGKAPQSVHLTRFGAAVKPSGTTVGFTLRSDAGCSGTLSGLTAKSYAPLSTNGKKRHKVSLGTARFTLTAGKAKTVLLTLSKPSQQLLKAKGSLKSRFTIKLKRPGAATTVLHRSLTLKLPQRRR